MSKAEFAQYAARCVVKSRLRESGDGVRHRSVLASRAHLSSDAHKLSPTQHGWKLLQTEKPLAQVLVFGDGVNQRDKLLWYWDVGQLVDVLAGWLHRLRSRSAGSSA